RALPRLSSGCRVRAVGRSRGVRRSWPDATPGAAAGPAAVAERTGPVRRTGGACSPDGAKRRGRVACGSARGCAPGGQMLQEVDDLLAAVPFGDLHGQAPALAHMDAEPAGEQA